jgi:S1-C subfamily serine protease
LSALAGHKVGDVVTVTVLREGENVKVPVTLQALQ